MDAPFQNGFLVFTLGALFILSVYHLLLYFQNRERLYLLYSGYTFFIILSQAGRLKSGFLHTLTTPFGGLMDYSELYTEIYYILYFFFAFQILQVRQEFPKWTRACMAAVYVLAGYCALKFLVFVFGAPYEIVEKGYYVFVVYMLVLSAIAYYLFFSLHNPLRYYIIVGSLILLVTSCTSLILYEIYRQQGRNVGMAYSILYAGFILENLLFSLGLGQNQKQIIEERNQAQQHLIAQLRENEQLREQVRLKMVHQMKAISQKAEADKLDALKANYDKELTDLRMAALRSQMNPHFIFNALNSIKRYIIDNEKEQAVYYLNKFSKLIRMILAATSRPEVTLEEELQTALLYLDIENIRFGNQLHFTIEVSETVDPRQIKIPSLLLQPFLENAIWHGLSRKEGEKRLSIRMAAEGVGYLRIEMEDNGIGRQRAEMLKKDRLVNRESVGLRLTRERLDKFSESFRNPYTLEFRDLTDAAGEPTGTCVVLRLPCV